MTEVKKEYTEHSRCKIRGIPFVVLKRPLAKSSYEYQAVSVGCEPGEYEWYYAAGTAKHRARELFDAANAALERLKDLEPDREPNAAIPSRVTVLVEANMEPYSEWGWQEHVEWIAEQTGLPVHDLRSLVFDGGTLLTDESCSYVLAHAANSVHAPSRVIYKDLED